jgi:hypothetical protein
MVWHCNFDRNAFQEIVGAGLRETTPPAAQCYLLYSLWPANAFHGCRMQEFNREQLAAYLDDSLGDEETALVEKALRQSDPMRRQLRALMAERDRGEHSIGAIWRRCRLTCPSREQLGNFLLQVVDSDIAEYIDFHLQVVSCAFCQANLADLRARQVEPPGHIRKRRQRYFESSAGLLRR